MKSHLRYVLGMSWHLKFIHSEKDTKFLQNHHLRFVRCSNGQIYGGDFAKFCGLLRIYEFYKDLASSKLFTEEKIPAMTISHVETKYKQRIRW